MMSLQVQVFDAECDAALQQDVGAHGVCMRVDVDQFRKRYAKSEVSHRRPAHKRLTDFTPAITYLHPIRYPAVARLRESHSCRYF